MTRPRARKNIFEMVKVVSAAGYAEVLGAGKGHESRRTSSPYISQS
jgi:hypothetical protein